jgi:hypothetical protein
MFDLTLREIKERLLGECIGMMPLWATPNHITLLSFFFGIVSALLCFSGDYTCAIYMWVLNRFFDGMDGNNFEIFTLQKISHEYKGTIARAIGQ